MEKIITCPVCFNPDNCFEELQESYSSYLCFNCGFMSDSRYETDSIFLIENLKKSPKLVQALKVEDERRSIVWFPSVINMGKLGLIFPEGHPSNWSWRYAPVVKVVEDEQEEYGGHTHRLDMENALVFDKNDFLSACKEMGITKDLKGSN